MSEYWKSNAKKYCDYCKVWIADNKASIGIHEGGRNHKENVRKKLDEIKQNAMEKKKEEKKYMDSMAAIEKAAMDAMEKDLSANPSLRNQYGALAKTQIAEKKKADLTESKKEAKKESSSKSSTVPKKADKQAVKKKTEPEPESKIGKWQSAQPKTPVLNVAKPKPIDLQLPTAYKPTTSAAPPVEEPAPVERNKWVPVAAPDEPSEPKDQEETPQNTEDSFISSGLKDEPKVPTTSTEVKSEPLEKSDSSELNKGEKRGKKEKIVVFKKRKIDNQKLRERAEDD